jgi:hypothetical protein
MVVLSVRVEFYIGARTESGMSRKGRLNRFARVTSSMSQGDRQEGSCEMYFLDDTTWIFASLDSSLLDGIHDVHRTDDDFVIRAIEYATLVMLENSIGLAKDRAKRLQASCLHETNALVK